MGTGYLLDTNVLIDFLTAKIPGNAHHKIAEIINSSPRISIINKIELLSLIETPERIIIFVERAEIIPLSDEIAEKTIEIRRKNKLKLPDAVIAATAIATNLILVTHNLSDFRNIKGLKVLNSHTATLI